MTVSKTALAGTTSSGGTSGGGGTTSSVTAYLGQAATRCNVPNAYDFGTKQARCRSMHVMRASVGALTLVFPNFYVDAEGGTNLEKGPNNNITVTASVEYPENVFTQVTFGGSATGTVANLTVLASDSVNVSIPKNATFWVRCFANGANGLPLLHAAANEIPQIPELGDRSDLGASGFTDNTMGGAYSTSGAGNTTVYSYRPIVIAAQITQPSFLLLGDSRTFGLNEWWDGTGDFGEVSRSIGKAYGYINCGTASDWAQRFVASHALRAGLATYVSHVIVNYGINDAGNGRTAPQIIDDLSNIAELFAGKQVYGATITPHSASTDSWTTTNNQTPNATTQPIRVAVNKAIRTVLPGFVGYFELADVLEQVRDNGIWKAGATWDGIHASYDGCISLRNSLAIDPNALGMTSYIPSSRNNGGLYRNQLITDMTLPHQANVTGINPAWSWGSTPDAGVGTSFPGDFASPCMVPWGIIATDVAGNPSTNVRVQIRKLTLDVKRNGVWTRICYNSSISTIYGAEYTNYETNTTTTADYITEGVDGIAVKPPSAGGSFHFFSQNRFDVAAGAQEIVAKFQARLIVDNAGATDDLNVARILAVSGADVWRSQSATFSNVNPISNVATGIGRFRYLNRNWKTFSSHTLFSQAEVDNYLAAEPNLTPR